MIKPDGPQHSSRRIWAYGLPPVNIVTRQAEKADIHLQVHVPLVEALQNGIQKHFAEMMEEPELIAAAVILNSKRMGL